MLDAQRMIAEVAKKNALRIYPDEPFFASVTVMQLALEESLQNVEERFRGIISEFESNVRGVELRAGKAVAKEAKVWAGEVRQGLERDIAAAGLKARELVQKVHAAHERPRSIFWASVGLLCALGLFCSGVWFGRLTALP
jgi:hypothetical protein